MPATKPLRPHLAELAKEQARCRLENRNKREFDRRNAMNPFGSLNAPVKHPHFKLTKAE